MSSQTSYGSRPWTFYVLATLFTLFVIFLYGPMIAVLVLSFQGPSASLVFPLRDPSLLWFDELFSPRRTGDVVGAFYRSQLEAGGGQIPGIPTGPVGHA